MADSEKVGRKWDDSELDAIVSDYFEMLLHELAGESFVKAKHSRILMEKIGRTHRSVEFKHQNISAVLDELGMPWIAGYIPKRNYQNAIFGAIDRYLTAHPAVLDQVSEIRTTATQTNDVFVQPPERRPRVLLPEGLQQLIRKFDPVERDHHNRTLGKAGEEFVVDVERKRLEALGKLELARRVRWVAAEDGDGAGYDVLSYEPSAGQERLIEVKTTNGSARTPFFLSRNEYQLSLDRTTDWRIYRVHDFAARPRIFVVTPPLESALHLHPETWRASP